MKGLLRREAYGVAQGSSKFFLPLCALLLALGWWQRNASLAVMMFCLLVMIMLLNGFARDEIGSWQAYAAALPLGRGTVVLAKYLFLLVGLLACLVFWGAGAAVHYLFWDRASLYATAIVTPFTLLAFVVPLLACIPLIYKYGVEKLRTIVTLGYMLPFMGVVYLIRAFGVPAFLPLATLPVLGFCCLAVAALAVASYQISKGIVTKMDY